MEKISAIVPLLLKLSSDEEEDVRNSSTYALSSFSTKSAVLAPYMDDLLNAYMKNEDSSLGGLYFLYFIKALQLSCK